MDRAEILEAFDRVFDAALVFHAFTDYMRDYEMLFAVSAAPSTGIPTEHLRYVFRHCVQADIESTVERKVWRVSLDDSLIDYESGVGRDGFVWGVKWQAMYPGARLADASDRASSWRNALGVPFHEAIVETNAHKLTLVFSDLEVETVDEGYAPFRVLPT